MNNKDGLFQYQGDRLNYYIENINSKNLVWESEYAYLYCRYVKDDPAVREHIVALHDLFYYKINVNRYDDMINNKIDMEIDKLALEFQKECGFDESIANN